MLCRLLAPGMSLALLQACSPARLPAPPIETQTIGPQRAPAPGSRWAVQSVDGEPAPRIGKTPAATLFLAEDGGIGGTNACNSVGSGYARWRKNGGFAHMEGPFITTLMACGNDDTNGFADRFWRLMGNALRWRRVGDELIIETSTGSEARLRLIEEGR